MFPVSYWWESSRCGACDLVVIVVLVLRLGGKPKYIEEHVVRIVENSYIRIEGSLCCRYHVGGTRCHHVVHQEIGEEKIMHYNHRMQWIMVYMTRYWISTLHKTYSHDYNGLSFPHQFPDVRLMILSSCWCRRLGGKPRKCWISRQACCHCHTGETRSHRVEFACYLVVIIFLVAQRLC